MNVTLINNLDQLQALEEDWNRLLENSASRVPFLRHEFVSSWWQTLGGGEWDQGDLFVLFVEHPSGQPQGIAPLFLHRNKLLFIGTHEIADYLDFIAPADRLEPFLHTVFEFLDEQSAAWETLELYNLVQDSPSLSLLQTCAHNKGWEFQKDVLQPAPCLRLPESWNAYLEGLDSKYRHEIERKIRRAEGYFLPVDWYFVDDPSHLEGELDAFLELMAHHPEKAEFLTDVMESHLKKTVRRAFQEGWAQLSFLTVGGKKAAGYLNFDFNNRIWVYNSGLNPMFENISPGWVLLGYLIQWAISAGRASFDFMRGDENYKYHFGGDDRFVVRARITRE